MKGKKRRTMKFRANDFVKFGSDFSGRAVNVRNALLLIQFDA